MPELTPVEKQAASMKQEAQVSLLRRCMGLKPREYVTLLTASAGFTILEVVMVMALMAVIVAVAVVGIRAMGRSSDIGTFSNEVNRIIYGINEYRLITKRIPSGTSWPASLNDFVDSSLRSRYAYRCDSSTGSRVTLTTTYKFNLDPVQKLKDQGLCTNDSYTMYNADKTVTCRVAAYANEGCI